MSSLSDPVDQLLELSCSEIERRAALHETALGVLHSGAQAFRTAISGAAALPGEIQSVPVTKHLDAIDSTPISRAVQEAAPHLSWTPSPRTHDEGNDVALAPINNVRDLGSLTCGLMLLAPGAVYPEHAHGPQEIYLSIAGGGSWRHGGDPSYRTLGNDELVYNHPRDVHSTVAGDAPVLALYILWP